VYEYVGMKLALVRFRKENRLVVFGTRVLRTVLGVYEGRSNTRLEKSALRGSS
jgi:hypothetical protein